ncbi:MAG: glycosyltransferase [Gemmatimonadetes bacterium]|nr:glycosyltransferase [Gemmatimonadota bacterium]
MTLALGLAGAVLLLVTWGLYPLVIALLARVAPARRAAPPAAWPSVTALLAARESPAVIEARVRNWFASDYAGPLDVVVALDPSVTEPWVPPADLAPRVRVVVGDAPGGKCANLNAAARVATGDVLVMGDAHQLFAPDAIRLLVAGLGDPKVGAVAGQLDIPPGRIGLVSRLYWNYERTLRANEARLHSTVGVSGSIYAMRRALWQPLRAGLILDDVFVPMRLVTEGWRIAFEARAIATESRQVEAAQEFRRKVRTLTGNYQLCAWLPAVVVPWRNPIWLQFVLHKLARLATPFALVAVLVGLAAAVASLARPVALAVAGVLAAVILLAGLSPDPLSRRLRRAAMSFGALVAAPAVAFVNAVQGKWDVWQPHARR